MNVERMVGEYLEHAEQQRREGVARVLAGYARRPRWRWRRVLATAAWWALCLAAGVLLGWVNAR